MAGRFNGEHVVVTGASSGIGFGIAEGFAAEGADLTILAENAGIADAAATIGQRTGARIRPIRCDITDRAAVRSAFAALGPIDVLINNAGLERMTPILEEGEEVEALFRRIIEVNVIGTYYVTREALRRMGPGGRIVLTSSVWGKTAGGGFSAYVTSKHANIGFMRSLARELGPKGIAVNAICPGWTKTESSMRSLRADAASLGIPEKELARSMLAKQCYPGLMEPPDLVAGYLFLASREAARNITGQTLHVDRGEVLD